MKSVSLSFVVLLFPATAAAAPLTQDAAPQHINGGAEVEACGWPTAVAVSGGGGLCTGTLIHPQVVVYAAHCGGGSKSIRFVESLNGFGQTVNAECLTNPGYTNQSNDFAFCVLEHPVELPTTPAVYGCELEILTPGREIAIVGFGNNDPGETGAGTKRWGETQIGFIDELFLTIPAGTSVCSGDSGGPAFVQYPDGTWHAFAIASTVTGGCGGSGTYGLIHNAIPFVEAESGIDVTPCHDVDGNWDPTPYCQGFFAGGPMGYGSWSDWCDGTPVGESSETCGEAFDAVPDDTAPAVSITSPMHLDYFDVDAFPGTIAITATDDGWGVRAVRMKINGEEQEFADDLEPWEFNNVNFPQGQWELVAIAEDWAGNVGESEPVLIGVGEQPMPPAPMTTTDGSSSGGIEGTSTSTTGENEDDDEGSTGGATGIDTPEPSGCGCRSGGRETGAPWLVFALMAIARARRSRRCGARSGIRRPRFRGRNRSRVDRHRIGMQLRRVLLAAMALVIAGAPQLADAAPARTRASAQVAKQVSLRKRADALGLSLHTLQPLVVAAQSHAVPSHLGPDQARRLKRAAAAYRSGDLARAHRLVAPLLSSCGDQQTCGVASWLIWEVIVAPEPELRRVVLAAAYLEAKRAALREHVKHLRGRMPLAKGSATVEVTVPTLTKGVNGELVTQTTAQTMTHAELREALRAAQSQAEGAKRAAMHLEDVVSGPESGEVLDPPDAAGGGLPSRGGAPSGSGSSDLPKRPSQPSSSALGEAGIAALAEALDTDSSGVHEPLSNAHASVSGGEGGGQSEGSSSEEDEAAQRAAALAELKKMAEKVLVQCQHGDAEACKIYAALLAKIADLEGD